MRALRWVLLGIAALLVVLGVALSWLVNSQRGAQWSADLAVRILDGKLSISVVRGTLSGPLSIAGLRYRDPKSGMEARIDRASVDIALSELLKRQVHVQSASAGGVTVKLGKPKEEEERKPFSLDPPIDVLLDAFVLESARVERDGKPLVIVNRARAAGQWTHSGIALREFKVDSPQGTIDIAGEASQSEGQQRYAGNVTGRFNWRQGGHTYAGELRARGVEGRALLDVRLSAPLAAQLNATLEQRDTLPWRFELRVPQFDPRSSLMPGSSLETLAANLQGAGDRSIAEVRGLVTLNRERLRIDPLRVRWPDRETIKLEALTLFDPHDRGRLDARGEVKLEPKPFVADLAVQWRDVSLPPEWVGQELATRGQLNVRGNPSNFNADGDLMLGPPKRLANIKLALNGTPRAIELERLTIVERTSRLKASGHVQLKPVIGWQIDAKADAFDPGSFIAGWPGRLNLTLASQGKLEPAGPSATLEMSRLSGTLRRRPVSGRASLTLNPAKVIAGNLQLRSGGSAIRLTGDRGRTMNVTANIDIASLDDWLPDSGGQLNGRFNVTGTWPEVRIAGEARGRKLALGKSSLDALNANVDVQNPLAPKGELRLDSSELRVGGFEFTTLAVQASGSEASHAVALVAAGDPLSGELRLSGSRRGKAWSGTLEQLKLAATDIAQLALRDPAQITLDEKGIAISQSCLAGESMSVCLAAQRTRAGNLEASYVIERVPLAFIAAVAKPDLTFELTGAIEGRGQVRRDAAGALFGEAHLASAEGGARERGDDGANLLSYENFKADAILDGNTARVSTSATLNPRGALRGEATLAGLSGRAPSIDGRVDLNIDDLAPVVLFTPQLADVAGRAEAHLGFKGPVTSPEITGGVRMLELAAEIPRVGIKLRDGELEAAMRPGGAISLTGHVTSGSGRLDLSGGTAADGVLRIKASGKNFLAADIPAARVVITPDLELTRNPKQMNLTGTVRVPRAAIDLTKLPEGGPQKASPDVVVIDDEAVEESRGVPLIADVTVILGDDVKLVGFGLDAKLTGRLAVLERPGDPTLGAGEIRVAGTYKAYGQDLTIQQGSLLFASTPINNPQVNIIAVRTLPDVTAKLTVTGSAQRPLLAVSADQAMSQTEALSYLMTGKPLNTLGTGEGDVVQSATRSLGSAAGNLLAKNVGKRIGVDELGIADSTEIGGSAFTVGQYLSPRLYLSYGVGLFEPGQVVTLRYRISDKVSLEASQGPLNQRAGINYRIEK